jgi:hypothetical protein
LSRGSERNDIYVAADDARVEVRHPHETVPGPDDGMTRAVQRSNAKLLASDSADDWMLPDSHVDALRSEQSGLESILRRSRPPDPRCEVRRLDEDLRRAREGHRNARWRREQALDELNELGSLGRLARRRQRQDIENRLRRAEADEDGHARRIE